MERPSLTRQNGLEMAAGSDVGGGRAVLNIEQGIPSGWKA